MCSPCGGAATDAFAIALYALLAATTKLDGLADPQGLADSWGRKLGSSVLQQLQQAGLMQGLPGHLTGAAQQLGDLQQLPSLELAVALADPPCHLTSSSAPHSDCTLLTCCSMHTCVQGTC